MSGMKSIPKYYTGSSNTGILEAQNNFTERSEKKNSKQKIAGMGE